MLLPRNYYIADEDYPDQIAAYKSLVATVAGLLKEAGVTDEAIATEVESMFELEKAIAAITVDAPDRRNETEMYNPTTLANLQTDYPVRSWKNKQQEMESSKHTLSEFRLDYLHKRRVRWPLHRSVNRTRRQNHRCGARVLQCT